MKIGIVTLNDQHNYGNRLQNLAVSKIINSYGVEAETIIIRIKEGYRPYKEKGLLKILRKVLPLHIFFILGDFTLQKSQNRYLNVRRKNFIQFTQQRIKTKKYLVNNYNGISKIKDLEAYDYFVTGSDQVWNPKFAGSAYHFLTFVPPEKRIGFIASMGVSELTQDEKKRYSGWLKQMKYISVREKQAADIIKGITGKPVDCFFDPVLLLSQEEWRGHKEMPDLDLPERYMLSFFLGAEPTDAIETYAQEKKLPIIHMNRKEYVQYYVLDPSQLLFLIDDAELILTDSFHVTSFSIIFEKQFWVFRRKQSGMDNMFSRMENLLGRLELTDRIQERSRIVDKSDISMERYEDIHIELRNERDVLDKTMKNVMGIK